MHILIANDDGYLAPGLLALVNALRPLGKVTVIAPEQNHSGASNSLTLSRPLTVNRVVGGERDNFLYVNGTPTDCVHVALTGLLDSKPDIVVSGINQGENMGEEIYKIARQSYLVVKTGKPDELYDMVHTENFVLVDQKGRIRGFYDGTLLDEEKEGVKNVKQLLEDIEFLSNQQ